MTKMTFTALAVMLLIYGCEFKNLEEIQPCKDSDISYSNDVVPILEENCYNCHSDKNAATFGENVNLEGYSNFSGWAGFKPNGLKSNVVGNIEHDPDPAFRAMPKGQAKLPECDISQIRTWVNEGMKNN